MYQPQISRKIVSTKKKGADCVPHLDGKGLGVCRLANDMGGWGTRARAVWGVAYKYTHVFTCVLTRGVYRRRYVCNTGARYSGPATCQPERYSVFDPTNLAT